MSPVLSIHPLPDSEEFVYGVYGLEPCTIRGIVRLIHDARYPIKINYLKVKLKGETKCTYMTSVDSSELIHRSKLLVSEEAPLLTQPETLPPESQLDIPFQINLPDPDHQSDILRVAVRVANLLVPSYAVLGRSGGTPFDARTVYTLTAEIEEPATLFSFAKVREGSVTVEPFVVYDPRLLPLLIQPDSKRWRSAPGESPIEYEVELSATTLGPGDVFRLAYRLAVAREDAVKGVRIKKVSLLIKEHRSVGTQNSRGLVRGSIEIVRWDFDESPPPAAGVGGGGGIELGELKPRRKTASGFAGYTPVAMLSSAGVPSGSASSAPIPMSSSSSSSPNRRNGSPRRYAYRFADSWSSGPGGDGLYVERDVELKVPSRGNFAPTTRPADPSLVIPVRQPPGPVAHVEIRHTLQVRVELSVINKTVVMECGCVLASVGREECERVLDESAELMPTLDYDKIFGNDVWVPPYEADDPIVAEMRRRREEEEEERRRAKEEEERVASEDSYLEDAKDGSGGYGEGVASTSASPNVRSRRRFMAEDDDSDFFEDEEEDDKDGDEVDSDADDSDDAEDGANLILDSADSQDSRAQQGIASELPEDDPPPYVSDEDSA
ncbi:hypothetical protein HDU96_008994 [Phlyctochytrium bullatum]|nr:hypothetical protein HDU96_008994 [Phlyctochytrium bullatum]